MHPGRTCTLGAVHPGSHAPWEPCTLGGRTPVGAVHPWEPCTRGRTRTCRRCKWSRRAAPVWPPTQIPVVHYHVPRGGPCPGTPGADATWGLQGARGPQDRGRSCICEMRCQDTPGGSGRVLGGELFTQVEETPSCRPGGSGGSRRLWQCPGSVTKHRRLGTNITLWVWGPGGRDPGVGRAGSTRGSGPASLPAPDVTGHPRVLGLSTPPSDRCLVVTRPPVCLCPNSSHVKGRQADSPQSCRSQLRRCCREAPPPGSRWT